MPYEFTLIGEHTIHTHRLLVLGTDGEYYEYDPAREGFWRIHPDDTWEIFVDIDEEIVARLRRDRMSMGSPRHEPR